MPSPGAAAATEQIAAFLRARVRRSAGYLGAGQGERPDMGERLGPGADTQSAVDVL